MRRTKIVCTLGPAVDGEEMLRELMVRGMNVARFNFSHGTHEEHKRRVDLLKRIRVELGLPMPLLLDTKGPEIRTGRFAGGTADLAEGSTFTIVHEDALGDATHCSITYKELPHDVVPGTRILIADGLVELDVTGVRGLDVVCTVKNGGTLGDQKGVNLPGLAVKLPALTQKDLDDIAFGVANGFDFIAASFVRKAADILEIRRVLDRLGAPDIAIIAKIENREGLRNFDEILKVADGIMVARGDLGIECPYEELPGIQRRIVQTCQRLGRPVIVATHMLESMITSPAPTRAEVTDVANAVHEQADAIMPSGETSVGQHPLACLAIMDRIARRTEREPGAGMAAAAMADSDRAVLVRSACRMAEDLKAQALVVFTRTGRMARNAAWFRPRDIPIYAFTDNPVLLPQLVLHWGTLPLLMDFQSGDPAANVEHAIRVLRERGLVTRGGYVVMATEVRAGDELVNTVQMKQVG